jgi:hypothetical protein
MDHYEVRIWKAWRRHVLFTLISHLFTIKLRRMYSATMDRPMPSPVTDTPVPLKEYRDSIIQAQNNQPISHPDIRSIPLRPQQILKIGLERKLIAPFLIKMGELFMNSTIL